jgi:plastocyanin
MSPQPAIPARHPGRVAFGRRIAAAGVGTLLALAIASAPAVLAADAEVSIASFAFDPASVTVTVGDSVTWTNDDTAAHTATGAGGAFDTGSIDVGGTASVTFNTAGTINYICTFHPAMTGTVVVEAAAAPSDAPSSTAPPTDAVRDGATSNAVAALAVILAVAALGAVAAIRRLAPERRRAG